MLPQFDQRDDQQRSMQPSKVILAVARLISRGRVRLGWLGVAGCLLVVSSGAMQRWAQAHGVHCPECNRPADMAFWTTYFNIKELLLGLGALAGLVAAVAARGAHPRLSGAVAVAMSLFVLMTTPR